MKCFILAVLLCVNPNDLGHDDYAVREAAAADLLSRMPSTECSLRMATQSEDLEVSVRAATILEDWQDLQRGVHIYMIGDEIGWGEAHKYIAMAQELKRLDGYTKQQTIVGNFDHYYFRIEMARWRHNWGFDTTHELAFRLWVIDKSMDREWRTGKLYRVIKQAKGH